MIRHVVMWKFRAEDAIGKSESAEKIRGWLEGLRPVISEIAELRVSENLVYSEVNWDVVLIADYESLEALEAYQVHPAHREVALAIKEIVTERATVDFEI